MTVRAPAPADRRTQIVDAAARVMGRQGYAATSMKDIAAEAGVAQALIHYYFGAKEDLLAAVVRSLCDEMRGEAAATMEAPDLSPPERIRAGIERTRARASERPERVRLLFDMISLSFSNPALKGELERLYRDETEEITKLIQRVTEESCVRLPMPARDLASVVIAAVDGLALQELLGHGDPAAAYAALEQMLVSAARPDS